jgi:hypothetical protein
VAKQPKKIDDLVPERATKEKKQNKPQEYSRPFLPPQTVKLNSMHSQQAFSRGYDQYAEGVYLLSIILPIYATPAQIKEADDISIERNSFIMSELDNESLRLDELAASNGIEFQPLGYTTPSNMTYTIETPRAFRFIEIMRKFDKLIEKIDTLWLTGCIDDKEYNNQVYTWKRKIIQFANKMRRDAGTAIKMAKEKEVPANKEPEASLPTEAIAVDNTSETEATTEAMPVSE